ncbi:MAG: DUF2530 domain-containing protein [Micromonosporaceae bacterium]|nr:DUF2530 domain-containing protein [Micromonosporaceae bacterium]
MSAAPEPLDPPMVPIALAGTAAWAVVGLVLLGLRGWLSDHGHTGWLWTCLAGVLLGLAGTAFMLRHDRVRARRRAAAGGGPASPAGGSPGSGQPTGSTSPSS